MPIEGPSNGTLRIAVVEDVRDSREALAFLINADPGMKCVASLASAEEALRDLPALQPDLILLDIGLAGEMSGADCIGGLRDCLPGAKIIMLTGSQDATTVTQCLMRGAVGYLHKSLPAERLPQCIRDAASGGSPMSPEVARLVTGFMQSLAPAVQEWEKLSPREQQVLELLAAGHFKKEIADHLGIAEDTVRTHCRSIYEKLHVNCREHAVAKTIPFAALAGIRAKKP
jgi:DNA-binding NarL/FixJ family response regulator